jgi:hypothetical protein
LQEVSGSIPDVVTFLLNSKTEFRNVANITREYVGDITEFIGDLKLALPPIVEWNCTIYAR